MRRLIRYESIITSLIGGLLGTAVGIFFAWLTTFAVEDLGVGFSVLVPQLLVFLLLAVVVGVPRPQVPRGASRHPRRDPQRVNAGVLGRRAAQATFPRMAPAA